MRQCDIIQISKAIDCPEIQYMNFKSEEEIMQYLNRKAEKTTERRWC